MDFFRTPIVNQLIPGKMVESVGLVIKSHGKSPGHVQREKANAARPIAPNPILVDGDHFFFSIKAHSL
jgi:hypothetical protein